MNPQTTFVSFGIWGSVTSAAQASIQNYANERIATYLHAIEGTE